jgi:hypothetical protein
VFWEGRGRYVLRASPKRPISLNRYALGGSTRVDQIERAVRTGVREQPRALADDHGIDDKVELVDQVIGEQPSEEDTAAGHKQVALLLRFRSRMATAMSPVRAVVPVHCGSVRVVDATYLVRSFNAEPIVLVAISGIAPQERAKISYVRRPKRNAAAPP